jgi:hypothetical protein
VDDLSKKWDSLQKHHLRSCSRPSDQPEVPNDSDFDETPEVISTDNNSSLDLSTSSTGTRISQHEAALFIQNDRRNSFPFINVIQSFKLWSGNCN